MIPLPPSLDSLLAGHSWTVYQIAESGGQVFGVGDAYLKHGEGAIAGDVADEYRRLAWAQGRIPVPELRHVTAPGDQAWLGARGGIER